MSKKIVLFAVGGGVYTSLELLWRGRSHWTMFVLGGGCFLAIGELGRRCRHLPGAVRAVLGSAVCTAGELREEFPDRKLIVIDTLCASRGQGLLVYSAAKLRDEGRSIEDTAAWVEDHKRNLCHWVTVEDLMHLKRGGRIGAATAVVGTMLNIKPIIRVDDEGKLENLAKCRGRKAALNYLLDRMAESWIPELNDTVYIGHGDCMADAEYLKAGILERFGDREVLIDYVGAVIGAHTGPGVVFIAFYGKQR